jgi:hypothetical protein
MVEAQEVATSLWQITIADDRFGTKKTACVSSSANPSCTAGCGRYHTSLGGPGVDMADQHPDDYSSEQRPPAYTGPFLFVNKNAQNLRSKQRDEVFAVRSHAMQIARRSRKPSSQSQSQDHEAAAPEAQHEDTASAQSHTPSPRTGPILPIQQVLEQQAMGVRQYQERQSQARPPGHARRQSTVYRPQRGGSSSGMAQRPPMDTDPGTSRALLPAEQAASLSWLSGNMSPPSSSPGAESSHRPASDDVFFSSALQFWRLGFMSNFWPAHIYSQPAHRVVGLTEGWLRNNVLENPALLHGVFAGALSYISNYLPPTDNTPTMWARAIHHYGKCLEETRVQLARPGIGAELALSLINGMSTFTFHCQDLESCQVHLMASMRLLRNLEGGLDSIHPVLKHLLILGDSLTASHVPRRPSIEIDSWAPKPWAEESTLRAFDELFHFDSRALRGVDWIVFLLDDDAQLNEYLEDLLQLINWHREALAANELGYKILHGLPSLTTTVDESTGPDGSDRADRIYSWLSLRQYALSCRCSDMFVTFMEMDTQELTLTLQLQRMYHSCVLLATSYIFQFVMRRTMDAPCMAYIPCHHLRTRLELLMALMSQYRQSTATSPRSDLPPRPPANPIPTDGLLFLFFAGALGEEFDGPSRVRAAHGAARAGVMPSPSLEHPGDFINDRWFSVHFSMVAQRLGIDFWTDAQQKLRRFMYVERILDHYLQMLVAKKLDFLAALVSGTPGAPAPARTGYFGGDEGPQPMSRPGISRQSSQQSAEHQATLVGGSSQNMAMHVPGARFGLEQVSGSLSVPMAMFEGTGTSLAAGMPSSTSGWWQETGYGMGADEVFSLDLGMPLDVDARLEELADLPTQHDEGNEPQERHGG